MSCLFLLAAKTEKHISADKKLRPFCYKIHNETDNSALFSITLPCPLTFDFYYLNQMHLHRTKLVFYAP